MYLFLFKNLYERILNQNIIIFIIAPFGKTYPGSLQERRFNIVAPRE